MLHDFITLTITHKNTNIVSYRDMIDKFRLIYLFSRKQLRDLLKKVMNSKFQELKSRELFVIV